jgi:hypothetical protein
MYKINLRDGPVVNLGESTMQDLIDQSKKLLDTLNLSLELCGDDDNKRGAILDTIGAIEEMIFDLTR